MIFEDGGPDELSSIIDGREIPGINFLFVINLVIGCMHK